MIRVAAAIATAALLAACGGASPGGAGAASALAAAAGAPAFAPKLPRRSWMSRDASAAKALLYISDAGTFEVRVYAFPSLKLSGTLTGFERPQGECTDRAGNVWITNTVGQDVLEYAHGGTSAIALLADPTGYPVGCAIDPASGDLAVTNIYDLSGGGGVLVYKNARGTPRPYSDPTQHYCYFDGYDAHGNLYVSGSTGGGAYVLTVLPKGGGSLARVTVQNGTIHYPGTVAWTGATLVLGDQKCAGKKASCLYQASVSGRTASITGTTPLGNACDVAQAWVGTTQTAAGDYEYCGDPRSGAALWPYPGGGSPSKRVAGLETPVGAALSRR